MSAEPIEQDDPLAVAYDLGYVDAMAGQVAVLAPYRDDINGMVAYLQGHEWGTVQRLEHDRAVTAPWPAPDEPDWRDPWWVRVVSWLAARVGQTWPKPDGA